MGGRGSSSSLGAKVNPWNALGAGGSWSSGIQADPAIFGKGRFNNENIHIRQHKEGKKYIQSVFKIKGKKGWYVENFGGYMNESSFPKQTEKEFKDYVVRTITNRAKVNYYD